MSKGFNSSVLDSVDGYEQVFREGTLEKLQFFCFRFLREALQRKNLVLIENEVGDFVVIDVMKIVRGREKARVGVVASVHNH